MPCYKLPCWSRLINDQFTKKYYQYIDLPGFCKNFVKQISFINIHIILKHHKDIY